MRLRGSPPGPTIGSRPAHSKLSPPVPAHLGRYDESMAVQPATTLPLHRLDVETYNRMVDCGVLDGQPVELLEGVLVEVSPPSPAHATVTDRLTRHLSPARQWWLRVQSPLEVPSDSVPE